MPPKLLPWMLPIPAPSPSARPPASASARSTTTAPRRQGRSRRRARSRSRRRSSDGSSDGAWGSAHPGCVVELGRLARSQEPRRRESRCPGQDDRATRRGVLRTELGLGEDDGAVHPAEAEGVRDRQPHPRRSPFAHDVGEASARGIDLGETRSRHDPLLRDDHGGDGCFDRPGCRERVPDLPLRARHRNPRHVLRTERLGDGGRLHRIVERSACTVRVHVIDLIDREARARQGTADITRAAVEPLCSGVRDVVSLGGERPAGELGERRSCAAIARRRLARRPGSPPPPPR